VKDKMNSDDVLEVMHRLLMKHGKPEFIRSDNGGEFVAEHLQEWLRKVGVTPIQIYPGSPWENGYNERFNGILRHEVLKRRMVSQCQTSASRDQYLAQGNTITSDLIMRSECDLRCQKPY